MAAPVRRGEELDLRSTRSRTAGTASRGTRASSSSCAADCPAIGCRHASPRSSAGSRKGSRAPCPPARAGSRRGTLPLTSEPAAAAGSRTSRTTRSSRRRQRQVRDALVRIGRFAEPPLEPIVPATSHLWVPQQARVLVHDRRGRDRAGLPSRRPLGRSGRDRGVPPDHRARQRDPARRSRLGARGAARRRTTRQRGAATCGISSSAKGETRGRRSFSWSPHRASGSRPATSSTSSGASRRCAPFTGR